jgi:hypothetical protein
LIDPNAHPFPFVLHVAGNEGEGLGIGGAVAPNLSKAALRYCAALNLPGNAETSRMVWHHVLAIAYSPAWLAEHGDGIRQGWPRVPLPDAADLLRASAEIGERVAALLDPQTAVPGVSAGAPRPELACIAVPMTAPGAERDWRLTAGWGSRSQRGITMPGRGRADERPFTEAEHAAAVCSVLLGDTTHDVWMNDASYWRNIPEKVWDLSIGGYRVLKKWLSYREESIIERPLSEPEVSHFQATARRLAVMLLMTPELDANYWSCAETHWPFEDALGGADELEPHPPVSVRAPPRFDR